MRTLFLIAGLIVFSTSLSACNTIDGLGQDIENAGESIQNL